MVSENEALRLRRLVFYAEDTDAINKSLLSFVRKSQARCALLIDCEGHLVAKQGHTDRIDTQGLAALVAGSFASTREVARLLGESTFDSMLHQGPEQSISISLVADRALQIGVFGNETKPGMIRVLSRSLAQQLDGLLLDMAARQDQDGATDEDQRPQLDAGFADEVKNQLDDLFGGL